MPVTVFKKTFNDFEALADIVPDNRSEIVQLGRGCMTGSLTHLSLSPSFGISSGCFSHGLRAMGVLSDNRWTLAMLLASAGGDAVRHGTRIKPGDLAVAGPGEERHVRFQDGTRYFTALVDPAELRVFMATLPGAYEQLERRRRLGVLKAAAVATAASNVEHLQTLLHGFEEHGATMADDTAAFYKRNLLELLTAPLYDSELYREAPPRRSANLLVAEVDRYIIDAGSRPIHISEICERFHIHRRTLHRAFNDALGVAPITFLRRKRLGDVHSELLQGGPDLHVREVAVRHGFIDQPRFAASYRRLFGEQPSTTLRNAPSRHPAVTADPLPHR